MMLFAEQDPLGGWGRLVENFGITAVCLGALAVAIWRTLDWVAKNVVVPVTQRHIKFLDDVTKNMDDHREDLHKSMEAHQRHMESMETRIVSRIERLDVRATNVTISPSSAGVPHESSGGGR